MPVPIIDLQRRLTLVGAIRAGGEKKPKSPGAKLEAFRLTTPRKELIEQAAGLYGGKPAPWNGPNGNEWQLYTEASVLPVLVMPHYSLTQRYELWEGAAKLLRVCDGIEMAEGAACQCNAEGDDRCDIYTRLVVALPELDTVLGWRLITRGANAAHELPTMLSFIERSGAGQAFVPARLVLDQRRGVREGQVVRYVVPTLDLVRGYAQLAGGGTAAQLPPASPPQGSPGVLERPVQPEPPAAPAASTQLRDEALDAVTGPPAASGPGGARAAAPLPAPEDIDFGPVAMTEAPNEDEPPDPGTGEYTQEMRQTKTLTQAQSDKLDVLVGQLRDRDGAITTEHLWMSVAHRLRDCEATALIAELDGYDEEGVLHWAPLRKKLTRAEASQLIDWLQALQDKQGAPV